MTGDTSLDISITEPAMTAGEVETLLVALDRSRGQFAWKRGDLDAGALTKAYLPSSMILGGLLKHLAFVDDWTAVRLTAHPMSAPPWTAVDWDADRHWPWHSAANDSPQELYRLWREAAAQCCPTPGACSSTSMTSTPDTSDTPTSSARRLTVSWGRTRHSQNEAVEPPFPSGPDDSLAATCATTARIDTSRPCRKG